MVVSVTPRHTAVSYSNQGGKQAIYECLYESWQPGRELDVFDRNNPVKEIKRHSTRWIYHDYPWYFSTGFFLLCSQIIQSDPHSSVHFRAVMMTFAAVEWTWACLLVLSRALALSISISHSDVTTSSARSTTSLLTVTTMTVARWPLRPDWPLTTGRSWSVPQQTYDIHRIIVLGVKKREIHLD